VENEETLQLLKGMGVDCAQGNYIGQPREAPICLAQNSIPAEASAQSL
jgi:EAL domain-containing protein (putative c-di-GMP-specific phosphodiesterase class I)